LVVEGGVVHVSWLVGVLQLAQEKAQAEARVATLRAEAQETQEVRRAS
jgi:hypothetical protein